ncbi:MAG: hypothetical protein D6693_03705 [Planctomycetota bacterium]|nr:MAG: hypothetical protein D6693_03705 [Planctomycetota bacterium]
MTIRRWAALAALALTVGSVVAWAATGREVITKRVRIVVHERPADPEDIMDIARADADGVVRQTVREQGLWFGLIPGGYPRPGAWAPTFEWLSALTVSAAAWIAAGAAWLVARRPPPSPRPL